MAYSKQKTTREAATTIRARKYGLADQMRHEREGRMQRAAMKDRMAKEHAEAKRKGAVKAAGRKGGTAGSGLGKSRIATLFGL